VSPVNQIIPQIEPSFGEEERIALNEYMKQGGWITEFKVTREFEQAIATYTQSKHCIAVNNGTISLSLIAMACGIEPGDEIIIPNYTMIATPNSIRLLGAKPIFVDVERETLCLDIKKVRKVISSQTKAIMLVSANGRYPKEGVEVFQDFCDNDGVILIEDAAQSLGSRYPNGQHIGNIGIAGSFSFSAPKIISTGQGGAIITNDNEIADKIRKLKDFGRIKGGIDIHDFMGYNFKFTDLQACVGVEQMKKLPLRVERKKEIYRLYKKLLENTPQVTFFDQDLDCTTPWFIDVLVESRKNLILP